MNYFYTFRDPLTIVVIGISAILLTIFLKELTFYLRRILPKKVECWFCRYQTLRTFETANSWVCENCDQYNGFSKNGDYNRQIPSQYESKMNPIGFAYQSTRNNFQSGNKLCYECTLKQQLKVEQLAAFVPINDKYYDKEVEHFEKQIEKAFQLCSDCEILVSKVLQNIREELSLPKKLTVTLSKIKIRGERAIFINIFLSLLVAFSSLTTDFSIPLWLREGINQTIYSNGVIRDYYLAMSNHSLSSAILTNTSQILIGTGIFTNSVGFYQTFSPVVFLNSLSWILMFFLTLYPSGYDDIIGVLKTISSVISLAISVLILLRNNYKRNRRKPSMWENRNIPKPTTPVSHFHSRSPSHFDTTPLSTANGNVGKRESPSGINSGMNNLSLGVKQRKELSRPSSRLVSPANFNPFCKVSSPENNHLYHHSSDKTSGSERNYQSSKLGGSSHYEPSLHSAKVSPTEKNFSIYSRGGGSEWNCQSTSKVGGYSVYEPSFHLFRTSPSEKASVYSKTGASERGAYQSLGKSNGYYEPSFTPPPTYESYESSEPVTTLTSCPYPQSCFPCTPTHAYYFAQHTPKFSPSPFPSHSTPNSVFPLEKKGIKIFWPFLFSLPFIFLVICNVLLLSTVYFRGA